MTDTNDNAENGQNWGEEMDRPEHEKTYEVFLDYTKWSLVLIGIILVVLLLFVYD